MGMKRFFLLLVVILLSMQICLAEDEPEEDINSYFTDEPPQENNVELQGFVQYNEPEREQEALYLEPVETQKVNFSKPKRFDSKSLISGPQRPIFTPIQDELSAASKFSSQEYSVRPVSTSYSRKFGKFSFGTTYDSSLSSASTNYSTGIFSKYEGKHFAFTSGFVKDTNINSDSFNDKIYIAPELKLTKNLSFLDIMQTDVNQIDKKNEFVLRYTPHLKKYADDVQFELGAGQSFYEANYVKSSVHFSTRFNF